MKSLIAATLVIACFLIFVAWLILIPLGARHDAVIREHHERVCHSRGYHWWDERNRCVIYVGEQP